jgi:hypothetical protein
VIGNTDTSAKKVEQDIPDHRTTKKGIAMSSTPSVIHVSSRGSVALPRGRLIFGLDATASREATWNVARDLQAKMFREAAPYGRLDVQLAYYRGSDECKATKWLSSGDELARLMNKIDCRAGRTQIGRILQHTLRENEKAPVQALTFIGDACEEEVDTLASLAGEFGAAGVPIFMFQEGRDTAVRRAFRLLALKSGGAYFELNPDKIDLLAEQLGAVARLAVGDVEALGRITGTAALISGIRRLMSVIEG